MLNDLEVRGSLVKFEVGKKYYSEKRGESFKCLPNQSGWVNTRYGWQDSKGTIWSDDYVGLDSLVLTNNTPLVFEPGKVYFSKRLQRPVIKISENSWFDLLPGGHVNYCGNEYVGVPDLDFMVRGVHYEAAIGTAERLFSVLDSLSKDDV